MSRVTEARPETAVLTRVVLVVAGWLVALGFLGAVVAYVGAWTPVVAIVVAVVALALAVRATRGLPAVSLGRAPAALLVLAVIAVSVWTGVTRSEQVLPRRDSASYFQATVELSEESRRPVPVDPADVGGPETLEVRGLTLESPAFYGIGSSEAPSVQPQFMPGPAITYSLPYRLGGAQAAMWAPAVLAGAALLGLGLLVATTVRGRVGAWLATPAVLLVGACFPWLHTSRSTYSEPLAAVTLTGGLLALALATEVGEGRRRGADGAPRRGGDLALAARTALVAGVLVGGTSIVRIDALRETMLLVPVAALLLARGRTWARSLVAGSVAATLLGFAVAGVMSWRYLGDIGGSLVPLLGLVVLMGLACWALLRRSAAGWSLPAGLTRALPTALPALVVVVGVVLALRPLFMTVRQDPKDPGAMYVARMQAAQGLPIDGGRTYAEHSVEWLSWWVGVLPLVVALLALAVLARRLGHVWAKGEEVAVPSWTGPLLVATGSSLLTLWRPGITPDHPWADRRLLVVLPLVLLLVVAAAAWLVRARTGRRVVDLAAPVAAVAVLAVTVAEVASATWPHRSERIEQGQLAAVDTYCDAVHERGGTVVLALDDWAVNQWVQPSRGHCDVAALATQGLLREDPRALAEAVTALDTRVRERGGQLVLVASRGAETMTDLGYPEPDLAVDVTLEEDMRILTERPDGTTALPVQVWLGTVR